MLYSSSFFDSLWTPLRLPVLTLASVVLVTFVIVLGIAGYFFAKAIWTYVSLNILGTDQYAHIPRPKHTNGMSLIMGDIPAIRDAEPAMAHLEWLKETQSAVYTYRRPFYQPRLFITDPVALNYVLSSSHCYDYPKPHQVARFLRDLMGDGVLIAEGERHKQQRRVLQPAFSVSAVRDLAPTFFMHSNLLARKFVELVRSTEGPSDTSLFAGQTVPGAQVSRKGAPVFDVSYYIARSTFDIIGETGFSVDFHSLENAGLDDEDSVAAAFSNIVKKLVDASLFDIIRFFLVSVPGFQWIERLPSQRRRLLAETYVVLEATASKIINEKRTQILGEMANEKGGLTKADWEVSGQAASGGKDLLHLMMRANLASDLKESEKLSDRDLLAQMTTILFAGFETTSTATTFCLHTLAKHQDVQNRLRDEIEETLAGRDVMPYDELMAMPYLDKVVKELFRFVSPVTNTERVAVKDDVIPLQKAYKTHDGRSSFDHVRVSKGQNIMIPIQALNQSPFIWGPTAGVFDPERWDAVPTAARESGLPLHLLTFISGPHGCIGNRFAIAEFKTLLCALVRQLRYEPVEDWVIEQKQSIVVRSRVKGQEELGTQMPLRVSLVSP